MFQLESHCDRIISLSFIKEPPSLVSSGADNIVYIWDVMNGSKVGTLDLQDAGAYLRSWKFRVIEDRTREVVTLSEVS